MKRDNMHKVMKKNVNEGQVHKEVGFIEQHVVDVTKWTQSITQLTHDTINGTKYVFFIS